MSDKWTKGPWHVSSEFNDECVVGPDHRVVADCAVIRLTEHGGVEKNRANARLTAAAPDMAAALADLIETFEQDGDFNWMLKWPEFAKARDALAKARGLP